MLRMLMMRRINNNPATNHDTQKHQLQNPQQDTLLHTMTLATNKLNCCALKFLLCNLLLLSIHTFALSAPPVPLQEELGCSPTLSFIFRRDAEKPFYFDPLGLATDDNFARMREAELKHGRIAMVGVVSSLGKHFLQENDFVSYPLAGKTPPIFQLLHEWTLVGSIVFILACGIFELLLLVQGSPRDMPGDYGLGYFGVRDKGKNERSLISELENGRLAMMVMIYYLASDLHWTQESAFGITTALKAILSKLAS